MKWFGNMSLVASALLGLVLVCACQDQSGSVDETRPVKDSGSQKNAQDGGQAVMDKKIQLPPGVHNQQLKLASGKTLRYTIAVPKGFDPAKKLPLVFGLHYGGKVSPHYSRGFLEALILPGLDEVSGIVVAPDSLGGDWRSSENEIAVLELLEFVLKNYPIDNGKKLLTGFSMGGYGTWYLGSRHQDKFTALLPIAGAPLIADGTKWSIPVYIVHSKADTVVPIAPTVNYLKSLDKATRANFEFVELSDLPHFHTPKFAKPLKEAVPWLNRVWAED